jgi:hypothetical protein
MQLLRVQLQAALANVLNDTVRAQRIAQGDRHVRLSATEAALADIAERLTRDPGGIRDVVQGCA